MPSSKSPFDNIDTIVSSGANTSSGVNKSIKDMMLQIEDAKKQLEQDKQTIAEHKKSAEKEGYVLGFKSGKEEGFQAAYAEGRKQGYEFTVQEGKKEVEQFVQDLKRHSDKCVSLIDEWYEKAEEQLAPVAVAIAEKILHQELCLSRDSVKSIVKEIIAEVKSGTSVTLRVNPFDTALIEAHKEEILSAATGVREIEIVSDDSIAAGAIIESNAGVIDARIDMMLCKIVDSIRGIKK